MRRFVLTWLGLSVVASTLVAQVTPAAGKGAKSLNFSFGGLGVFGLTGTGPAGGLGLSYFLSPDAAVRVGVQVRSYKRTLSFNGPAGVTGVDGFENGFTVGGAVDYLKYLRGATSRVRPYLGPGIGVTSTSNSARPAAATGVTAPETRNNPAGIPAGFVAPGLTYDVHAGVGAEFFLFNELSVSGEYQLNIISHTSPSDAEVITGGTTVTARGNSVTNILGFGTLGAIIRIYF
jgi:hypothetical protein